MIVTTVLCDGEPALAERIGVDKYRCTICGAMNHEEADE